MNRIELLGTILLLAVCVVFVLKSKWFDRAIDWLMRGTRSTNVADLKADQARHDQTKNALKQDLDTKAAQVQADRRDLKSL